MNLYERTKHGIRFWLLRRLPPCKQTIKVISQSMERELSISERILLKLHLWVCMWCQWYMEHLELMRASLRAQGIETPDARLQPAATLSDQARERIKSKLREPQ